MKVSKLKKISTVLFAVILLSIVFTVTAFAEITVKNGTVVGLEPTKSYQYAPVTLANYNSPVYTDVTAGATKIEKLNVGLYYIYCKDDAAKTAIWIEGDVYERTSIGTVCYSDYAGKDAILTSSSSAFVAGSYSGTSSINHSTFDTYYLSAHSHVSGTTAKKIYDGESGHNEETGYIEVSNAISSIVFKYAYAPEEIIPVSELHALTYNVGVRQGSIVPNKTLSTKFVLYTMDEKGEVKHHEVSYPSDYVKDLKNQLSINLSSDFPNATGWVVGIEIYPFGVIPDNIGYTATKNSSGGFTNTAYFIEYVPAGYITEYSNNNVDFPTQYNGANKAYIEGYGDGTFAPDNDITKAEVATILARLVLKDIPLPKGSSTKFSDISVNDWYYDAVNFLEKRNVFNYITGTRLNPNKAITRGEFVQMIQSISKSEVDAKTKFKDVDESHPFYSAIVAIESKGVINGYADGTFRPDDTITRAEAVTILNRLSNLIADESTVVKDSLENTFTDISGHWAEYQVLIAANDNVKTKRHFDASTKGVTQTDTTIDIETKQLKVSISRRNGKVVSLINKYDNTDINLATTNPWFTYVTSNSNIKFTPNSISLEDGRLRVTYTNFTDVYFIIDVKDNYFTIEVDSNLPNGVKTVHFGNIYVNTEFSDDPDSYRISAVAMHMNTDMVNRAGGAALRTTGYAMRKFGTMGAKLGITFSKFGGRIEGEHRAYLIEILDAIDENVGIRSKMGSAYTVDNTAPFGDYVIQSSGLTPETAKETAQTLKKYSIDQLDFSKNSTYSFVQGNFNFVCARNAEEKKNKTFIPASVFKERIGDLVTAEGIQLGLHTYSSLVSIDATDILTNPKWQKQISHVESENLTLAADITATDTVFLTNEDPSGIKLYGEKAGGGTSYLPWSGPNTGYFLIDEEIVLVKAVDKTGLKTITRGQCGTVAAPHSAGSTIIHYLGHYDMFQPIPGSELFYHIADLTAQAYNDGGFEMIYLDGFESFARNPISASEDQWYYYASFIQRVTSQCIVDPVIEGSAIPTAFWNARARWGAVDHATRETKKYNFNHLKSNRGFLNAYLSATLGWFNYSPDRDETYKNTFKKTLFVDDLDYMGSMGVAFDMSTVANGFSVSTYNTYKSISNNTMYYSLYSRLRKGGYFSENVKKQLQEGILNGKEYKVEEQSDGSWAFREMSYFKHKVFDLADTTYSTGSATNPYSAQTPYVRIEQRYSTLGNNETTVFAFDETAEVSTLTGEHSFAVTDLSSLRAFKIKVYGNGNASDGILLTLGSEDKSETGRLDFFLPTAHTGWREFILVDADNADYDGYDFDGDYITSVHYATFRNAYSAKTANSVTVNICGGCTGVMIDDLKAYTIANSPAVDPSVTIGSDTITFDATVRSGEFIEYYPELNKAYHHSYDINGDGNGKVKTITEIKFTGSVTVPEGAFTYKYNATPTTEAPLRAKVVIGLKSDSVIANEASWTAPKVEIEDNLQFITLT